MTRRPVKSRAPRGGLGLGVGGEEAEGPGVRLQRVMADAGVAARRVCEQMIEDGRVEVNDEVVTRLPVFVDPFKDRITVDGRELARARRKSAAKASAGGRPEMTRLVYVLLNKPARVLTAASDPTGRVTVNELVKYPTPVRLIPVGRLEWEATGLVLLTNDGELVNRLTHPRYGVDRVFEVQTKGILDPAFLADLEKGVNLKLQRAAREAGKRATPITLKFGQRSTIDDRALAKTTLLATVKPGATVKLADLLGEAGVKVAKVTQVAMGPLKLVDVRPGLWRNLERHEVSALKKITAGVGGGRSGGGAAPAGPGPRTIGPALSRGSWGSGGGGGRRGSGRSGAGG